MKRRAKVGDLPRTPLTSFLRGLVGTLPLASCTVSSKFQQMADSCSTERAEGALGMVERRRATLSTSKAGTLVPVDEALGYLKGSKQYIYVHQFNSAMECRYYQGISAFRRLRCRHPRKCE